MDKNISVYTQLTMYAPLITILLTLSPHLVAIKTSFCNVHKMTQALLMILIGFLVVSIIFLYRHYFLNHTSTRIKRILQILLPMLITPRLFKVRTKTVHLITVIILHLRSIKSEDSFRLR